MNCTHLLQNHEDTSPAKLLFQLFGRKNLSKAQQANMKAAYNHTEFLNLDRERRQISKNICIQSESWIE